MVNCSTCWAWAANLACLQVGDGKVIWQKSLTRDFGGRLPMWRFAESPLIDGEKVVVTPGGQDAMLVALDKLTGKTIWKSQMPSSTPAGPGNVAGGPSGPGRGPGGPGGTGRGPDDSGRAAGSPAVPAWLGCGDHRNEGPGLFTGEHYGMSAFSCKISMASISRSSTLQRPSQVLPAPVNAFFL